MKASTIVWVIVIILVVFGIGWYFYSSGFSTPATSTQNTATDSSQSSTVVTSSGGDGTQTTQSAPMTATVTYGPNGFSPTAVTIAKGGTVTFTNQGGDEMWVASDPHPTHEGYSGVTKDQHCPDAAGVAFDQCSVGATYSFTFQKVGTWGYHNHGNSSDKGTIIVQ